MATIENIAPGHLKITFGNTTERDVFFSVVFPERKSGPVPGFFWQGRHTISCHLNEVYIALEPENYKPSDEESGFTTIVISDSAYLMIAEEAEGVLMSTAEQLPEDMWRVQISHEVYNKLMEFQKPNESMSDTVRRAILVHRSHGKNA
jgi:hypothetical protein